MATAISIITRSMRLIGALGVGETPTDDEAQDGLTALNAMLDSWIIERLFVRYIVSETLTLVANQATYTMGPSGDLNTTTPTQIEDSCFIRYSGVDTPCPLLDQAGYASIAVKNMGSNIPFFLCVDYQFPLVRLTFYPVPTSAGAVAYIKSWATLQSFSTLTTDLNLPVGNERALVYSLAEEYAPEFGADVPADVRRIAMKARGNLKRINAPDPIMRSECGYMSRSFPVTNIYTGG